METCKLNLDFDDIVRLNKRALLENLRQRKIDLNLTFDELAERANMSKHYVAEILSPKGIAGDRDVSFTTILRLLAALDLVMAVDTKEYYEKQSYKELGAWMDKYRKEHHEQQSYLGAWMDKYRKKGE